MGLANIVKPSLEQGFTYLFNKGIMRTNQKDQEKRDHSYYHVSSIGYCLKATYLNAKEGKEMELPFLKKVGLGSCIHSLYQRYLADSGNMYGNWYCRKCMGTTGPGFAAGECGCSGKVPRAEYSEFHFMNAKYKVSGHPDGLLKIHKPKVTLIEIKTISPYRKIGNGPEMVDKAVPEHKRQCNFYLHIMQDPSTKIVGADKDLLLAMLDTQRYLLIYHDKGSDNTIPYEFQADKAMYDKDLARVQLYHKCVKEGKEPPAEPSSLNCRYCTYVSRCGGVSAE